MIRQILGLFFCFVLIGCAIQSKKEVTSNIQVSHLCTIDAGGMNAVEISAYCKETKRLFTASSKHKAVLVYDISSIQNPKKITAIDISLYGGNVNSVAVQNGNVAMAIENTDRQDNGVIVVYDTKNLQEKNSYSVGALPDMVAYSPNGNYIISANEGEPNTDYTIDPKGSVTIVNTNTNEITTLDFEAFNSSIDDLKKLGLRNSGKNATFAEDAEPEYLTVSEDGKTAWVVLQENNAIVAIDIEKALIKAIYPLGVKDFSLPKNTIDVSDKDGKIQLQSWKNLNGFYLPDAITNITIKGTTYLITANEGDSRDYPGYSEEIRVANLKLDTQQFPNAKTLQKNDQLGRLKVSRVEGDIDNDGDYDELYAFGARSFSIWTTDGKLIYDSGNEIALRTKVNQERFNQNDTRSDDKGAEPEALATLKIKNKTLLFVGLERASGVLMYDISNPNQPIFQEWINHEGDISPEGLCIIPAADSPNNQNILVVSNEISGTISFFEVQ